MPNPTRRPWTRTELLVAYSLYSRMEFGQFHAKNPEIIKFSQHIGRTPSALAMKLSNLASLDPAFRRSGRKGLIGASRQDREIWREMEANWEQFALECAEAVSNLVDTPLQETASFCVDEYFGTERATTIQARIGQRFFREAVLSAYSFRCCISGLSIPQFLIASHIIPWRTDKPNRLNPRNGLSLSSIHDKAFDSGLLTLDEEYRVVISNQLKTTKDPFCQSSLVKFEGQKIVLPEKFAPDLRFLEHHRNEIFQDSPTTT